MTISLGHLKHMHLPLGAIEATEHEYSQEVAQLAPLPIERFFVFRPGWSFLLDDSAQCGFAWLYAAVLTLKPLACQLSYISCKIVSTDWPFVVLYPGDGRRTRKFCYACGNV